MKSLIIVLLFTLQLSILAQGIVSFDLNFGDNPPPHSPGIPASGAYLTNNQFYAILYLDTSAPVSGSIGEWDGTTFTTLFQFSHLVYAGYPSGSVGFDYEDSWELNQQQMRDLLAGQWYAQVTYPSATFTGQIIPVPEPAAAALLLMALAAIPAVRRRRKARPIFGLADK